MDDDAPADSSTVSVIIPVYNRPDMLVEAVESVRAQTYRDFEVVVVDDGSTDETVAVARRLAEEWPAMRVIADEHAGTPANKNRGIRLARGQWLAFLDADDLWKPQKLRRCMDYLADYPEQSLVYHPMDVMDVAGRPMEGHAKACRAGWITRELFHRIFVHDPAVVFHRRVVETCGGLDEDIPVGSGHEFWLRVSTKFEFGLIDEPLATRRWHERSLTRSNRSRGRRLKAAMLERFYYQRGGLELLPRGPAMRRLSRVHYSAGKILLKEGEFREARRYLAKAIRYRPAGLKAYPFYLAAWAVGAFAGSRAPGEASPET